MGTLNFSTIHFANNENIFLSLAYQFRNGVAILDKFDYNGRSILSFKKHAFANIHCNFSL